MVWSASDIVFRKKVDAFSKTMGLIRISFKLQWAVFILQLKKPQQMSKIPESNVYTNTSNVPDPYGGYPAKPVYPTSTDQTTGTSKTVITKKAGEVFTQQKSSYHNPVTGVSDKINMESKRERSRSTSSERRRRRNMAYQNQNVPPTSNLSPFYSQPNNPQMSQMGQMPGYNQPINTQTPEMSQMSQIPSYNQPMNTQMPGMSNYNQPMNTQNPPQNTYVPVYNQPVNTQMPVTSHNPMNVENQPLHNPVYHEANRAYSPTDLYARKQGTMKTTDNMVKTSQKMTYIDPVTGTQQNAKIQRKVVGPRSRSRSNGKSKTTYDHKIEDTKDGLKTVIKQTHREGGILTNIKNKFHNMLHKE